MAGDAQAIGDCRLREPGGAQQADAAGLAHGGAIDHGNHKQQGQQQPEQQREGHGLGAAWGCDWKSPAPVQTIAPPMGRCARICQKFPCLVCGAWIGTTCGAVYRFNPVGH